MVAHTVLIRVFILTNTFLFHTQKHKDWHTVQRMRKSSILLFGGMMQSTGNFSFSSYSLPPGYTYTPILRHTVRQHVSVFDPVTHRKSVLGQNNCHFPNTSQVNLQDVDKNSSMFMMLHPERAICLAASENKPVKRWWLKSDYLNDDYYYYYNGIYNKRHLWYLYRCNEAQESTSCHIALKNHSSILAGFVLCSYATNMLTYTVTAERHAVFCFN